MTHDSHEEGYRYVQPQACIDELRAALAVLISEYIANEGTEHEFVRCITPDEIPTCWRHARAAFERTK